MISPEALNEFKAIWEKEFGENIPDDIATEKAVQLLTLFDTVFRPVQKDWINKYENENVQKSQKTNL